MIKPGTYVGTLLSHGIGETKAGAPQAVLKFSLISDGRPQQIVWYGSFSEKAAGITLKALLICGLEGNNPAGDLKIGREVSLVIDDVPDQDGKLKPKVLWVNAIGGSGSRNVIAPDLAKAKLSSLEGAVAAAREKLGIDEIPF